MSKGCLGSRVPVSSQAAWVVLAGFLALAALVRGPSLLAHGASNWGMITLRDSLPSEVVSTIADARSWAPAVAGTLRGSEREPYRALLESAANLDPQSSTIRWALGRAALLHGDWAAAVDALMPMLDDGRHNVLLYVDALVALSRAGMSDPVIALYEAVSPPLPLQAISDTVAIAYLGAMGPGGPELARQLRPGDLYANYQLWQEARQRGDSESAAAYRETLAHFPLESIWPSDERLLDYAAEVIPLLLEQGLWDRATTLRSVSYLVWQHFGDAGTEHLLSQLILERRAEADWHFWWAELLHRRGELEEADLAYRQVLLVDPSRVQAYLRLGMVAEARATRAPVSQAIDYWNEALTWYEQYHARCPSDLLGLKKLAQVYATLDLPQAGVSATELGARSDTRLLLADLVGIPLEAVELGPNLVGNAGLEEWAAGRPRHWVPLRMFGREPFEEAVFVVGADELTAIEGERVVRIDGLWAQRGQGRSTARAGLSYSAESRQPQPDIMLNTGGMYLFSCYYRTEGVTGGKAAVWLPAELDQNWAGYRGLPQTDGAWYRLVVLGWSRSAAAEVMRPLLSSWALGSVEFDNVEMRAVQLGRGIALGRGETRFWVIDAESALAV